MLRIDFFNTNDKLHHRTCGQSHVTILFHVEIVLYNLFIHVVRLLLVNTKLK